MSAVYYQNTKAELPNWNPNENLSEKFPIGYAYETDKHFVHLFGSDKQYHSIQVGLTVIEGKNGSLNDWITRVFGAQNIKSMNLEPGNSIQGVWRPSLYFYADLIQALDFTDSEMRLSEQALKFLIEKLDEILSFIEPENPNLDVYGHKIRELLILACTEVENFWQYFMRVSAAVPNNGRTFNTTDYVKLLDALYLKEFQFKFKSYESIPPICPFKDWDTSSPTQSLNWYDSYNKCKHDRESNFSQATLRNTINAVVACLVLHFVRFGPWVALEQNNSFSAIFNQHFSGEFDNPEISSFYLPKIAFPSNTRTDRFVFDPRRDGFVQPYIVQPLNI